MLVLFFVYDKMIINTCLPSVPILYPLGTSKKISFSDVFRGYKKRTLGRNGLKYICCMNFVLLRVFLCFLYWYLLIKANIEIKMRQKTHEIDCIL